MILEISIKNFKSIKDSSTKFPKFIGAIVGKNAVGKTNLIQAINFVRNLATGIDTNTALKKIALTPQEIYNYNESSSNIEIKVQIATEDENKYLLELTISPVNGEEGIQNLLIKSETLKSFDNNDIQTVVFKRNDSVLMDKDGNNIPLAVEQNKLALSLYQESNALKVKNTFSNIFVPDQDSVDFRESIVKSDEKGLASLIVRLRQSNPASFEQDRKIIKKLLPHFSSIVEIPSKQPTNSPDSENLFMVLLEEENLKGKLSMKSVSAGDLRTLYIIASAMYLKPNSSFIFEEIENGLHPKRLKDLLDHLTTISRKKDMQIIFTTHSSAVINLLSPSDVVYVEREIINGTQFHLLADSSHITQIDNALKEGISLTDYIFSRLQ